MHSMRLFCLFTIYLPLSFTNLNEFIENYLNDHVVIITTLRYLDKRISSVLFNGSFTKTFLDPRQNYTLELYENVSYILIEDSFQDFAIEKLNTKAKFLVILHEESTVVEVLKQYFKKLWDLDIYHVMALVNMSVFTKWYPYDIKSKCGKEVVLVKSPKVYYEKFPRDLNGCPIKMLWMPLSFNIKDPPNGSDPGLAPIHLNTIARKLNFTVIYIRANDSHIDTGLNNGNYDHIRNLIDNKTIDMSFTAFRDTERTENMDCSLPFLLSPTLILLPPRKKIIKSISLLGAFTWETWLAAFLLTIVMVFSWKFMSANDLENSAMFVIQTMLQTGTRRIPAEQIHFWILSMSFLLYSMSLNAIYLSAESSITTRPNFESKIKNLGEFLQTEIPLKFSKSSTRGLLPTNLLEIMMERNISPKTVCRNAELIKAFVKNPNHGLIIHSPSIYFFKNPKHLETFTDTSFLTMMFNAHARKNFMLLDKINWWIAALHECGLWEKWLLQSLEDSKKFTISSPDTEEKDAISLKRLYEPFAIWLVGLFMATLVFCAEFVHSRPKKYF